MKNIQVFEIALGLGKPWYIESINLDADRNRLDIRVNFTRGAKFSCPSCGTENQCVHDTMEKTWRHLDFFQFETYVTARVPRVKCRTCGVHQVRAPWSSEGSGFTLLFERRIIDLAPVVPVKTLGQKLGVTDTRVWRLVKHHLNRALEKLDLSRVTRVGFDETSSRRGHDYVSIFVDLDTRRAIFATDGKDSSVLARFRAFLTEHGGRPENIRQLCCDMSPAFIKGARENFPTAELTFDKFHVIKIINEAVDETRREERKTSGLLSHTRYLWLKSPEKLTSEQSTRLEELSLKKCNRKTARAYHLKLIFQDIFSRGRPVSEGAVLLKKWYFWARHSRLDAMKDAAQTIKAHWDGILQWFTSQVNNAILEGTNSLVQAAKAKARGYRNKRTFIDMIYLVAGQLNLTE